MPVDFLFERVENAQPRIRTECRSRNGHRVLSFLAGRGWDRPCIKLISVTESYSCQQRSKVHELARTLRKIESTERHTSTKNFCLWKSFRQKFLLEQNQNVGRNFCQALTMQLLQTLCNAAFRACPTQRFTSALIPRGPIICLTSIVDLALGSA